MADSTPKSYSADPTLYLYTSLTAGSSHIITATSRLETILKANKIPFRALDVATDEKARMLWGRRSKGRKLPGLVKFGSIVGDLDEVEEWNEYGELKEHIGAIPALSAASVSSTSTTPSKETPNLPSLPEPFAAKQSSAPHISIRDPADERHEGSSGLPRKPSKNNTPLTMAMRQAGAEAAKKAGDKRNVISLTQTPSKTNPLDVPGATPEALLEATLSKSAEEPTASSEMTAGKHPTTLAAEGAQRTSVDKIADANDDTETASSFSKEESLIEARRTSSIAKNGSPLAMESAAESAAPQGEQSEAPSLHRDSSVSVASKEEIDSEEKTLIIPGEGDEANREPRDVGGKEVPSAISKGASAGITASDEGEQLATNDTKPQKQDAKDGSAAGISVGD